MREQAPSASRHYSESPMLTFWGTDLHVPGDPATEEEFYTTMHCLEGMTTKLTAGEPWQPVAPQTVAAELTHFNQSVTTIRQGAGMPAPEVTVTLDQLYALSLRRLLALADTNSASPSDDTGFVKLHTAIFLAFHEEQEMARLKEESTTEQLYSDEELPY